MKRLTILAVIAIFAMSVAGCGRQWGRWWNRGAFCMPQQQQTYAPVEVYEEGAIIQQGPAPRPGLPPLPPGPVQTAPGP